MASTRPPSGRSMPTRTSPCWDQRTRCLVSSSKPCCEWATVARPQILPAGSTTQTSWDSAAQSMPSNNRPPFDRRAVPVAEARGGSLLTGARGASSHGRSALPEAGGGGGISLALEGRWHPALPPPVTEMLRACTLERTAPWSFTEQGWCSNGPQARDRDQTPARGGAGRRRRADVRGRQVLHRRARSAPSRARRTRGRGAADPRGPRERGRPGGDGGRRRTGTGAGTRIGRSQVREERVRSSAVSTGRGFAGARDKGERARIVGPRRTYEGILDCTRAPRRRA